MNQLNEKRQFNRYSLNIQIKNSQDIHVQDNQVKDISVNGLFVQSSQKVNIGDAISLNLGIPDQVSPIFARGTVARIDQDGFGIQFEPADPMIDFTGTIYSYFKSLDLPV